MKIGKNLTILPVLHGRMAITRAVRRDLNSGNYDVIALPLPSLVEEELVDVVQELPLIRAVVIESPDNSAVIPADPCDAFIEAVRQSIQLRIPLQCVGPDLIAEPPKVVSPARPICRVCLIWMQHFALIQSMRRISCARKSEQDQLR